ncbi:hypothetical protein [Paenibacillus humicola]|uniref:hypothetical protein n=1 Tax=Paenibacillus humicola TaxID=3110540 RepID=UPI00237B4273|nr:hypothetical protein [Paenibacillus humicola]
MSRSIELTEEKLILHLTGLTVAAALKKEIEVPYSSIRSVTVEDFQVSMLKFRIGASIADIREGRFLIGDRWCFISYENHNHVIVLELTDHKFGKVVFQTENPEETRDLILEKMSR